MTKTTESHFDTTQSAYERWCDPCAGGFSRAALDGAALPAGAAILDVCAGMGALAVPAAERGYHVRAIDISTEMIERANERLTPYPRSFAEEMDALYLQYDDNEFDAAFSVLGVVYFGAGTAKALTEMTRVVRPGGLVSVLSWADAMGAPFFIPVARAINRMDDPEVGRFIALLTEYLEGSKLEQALSDVGCIDTRSERVEAAYSLPTAETFMDELDQVFQVLPQYRAAVSMDRDYFREILTEEVSLMTAGELPPALANIAYAQVPSA